MPEDTTYRLRSQEFEWDEAKADSNRRRHGIPFRVAASVLFDVDAIYGLDDRDEYGEVREWVVGMPLARPRLIHVVYTERGSRYRIISAWKADANERHAYSRRGV